MAEDDILKRHVHGLPLTSSALGDSECRDARVSTAITSGLSLKRSGATAEEGYKAEPQVPSPETLNVVARSTRPPTIAEAAKAAAAAGASSVEDTYIHIQSTFTTEQRKRVTTLTLRQADSPLWMAYRRGVITASIAYSVYTRMNTVKTTMGPHDIRALLRMVMREQSVQTPAMLRGCLLEKAAKEAYAAAQSGCHRNLRVEDCGLLILAEHPCIGASPDGIVTCDCCASRVLEVKCPLSLDAFKAKEMIKEETLCLKKTSKYYCQVQVQMALAELTSADVFVFQDTANFLLFSVTFDEAFFHAVVDRAVYFFKVYVLPHIFAQ